MNTAYLSIGSNEGNRQEWLSKALHEIEQRCGVIAGLSSVYETAAWGLHEQPDFLNMATGIATLLSASDLLLTIQKIEHELGRERTIKWGQRTIDIDILFFNDEVHQTDTLSIPHPQLQERLFVLAPLAEIAPNLMHPILHKTISELLAECPDTLEVRQIKQPH